MSLQSRSIRFGESGGYDASGTPKHVNVLIITDTLFSNIFAPIVCETSRHNLQAIVFISLSTA